MPRSNEFQNLAMRYRKFNTTALIDAAVSAAGNGARSYIVSRWKHVTPATTPCPVQFSREELELHGSELELVEGLGEVLRQLQNDNLIPLGGMVPREDYEQVSHINNHVRETFVNLAESEQQRALYSQIWPYQGRER
ncbi:hypothetical protein AJ80_03994 [Polytolypa hystricis UAMH7299]|uniref:Uncharacterized protein n=1 Tax=Polytolypa hystricis (strain UAMH7299) TaxID=1447883 RepID=A0A2B7Y5B7_POLH7|nr:hypothetical protein AJ80_03994 [Polytolypa hystricis UAMH7299]